MSYAYYQQAYPGWGTSQFQLGPPPAPAFQPEAAWNGYDYYRAHAVNPNRSLFNSVLDRIRGLGPGYDSDTRYVGTHEARSIHFRVYSGLLSLDRVMPHEIGAAAGYEAYRTWKYHGSLMQPLGGASEREREALVGMALAETSHLWQYTGRPMDNYGLQEALETAAVTASRLYERKVGTTFQGPLPMYGGNYGYAGSGGVRPRRYSASIPSVVRSDGVSPYAGAGVGLPNTPLSGNIGLAGGTPLSGYGSLRASPYAGSGALPAVQPGGVYGQTLQPTVMPGQTGGTVVLPQPQVVTGGGYGGYSGQQPIIIQQQPAYGGYNGGAGYGGRYGGYGGGGYGGGYAGGYGGGYGGRYSGAGYGGYGQGYGGYGGGYSAARPIVIDASRSGSGRHHHRHHSRRYSR